MGLDRGDDVSVGISDVRFHDVVDVADHIRNLTSSLGSQPSACLLQVSDVDPGQYAAYLRAHGAEECETRGEFAEIREGDGMN